MRGEVQGRDEAALDADCKRGDGQSVLTAMIRIAISAEAFEAIARTLPLGSVGFEQEPDAKGERLIWLEDAMADRLGTMRGPGETYSDAILRLAKATTPRSGRW
jgi:hypothetical protein